MEAYHYNFVSKVYEPTELDSIIWPKIQEFSELPSDALRISKSLVGTHERDALYRAMVAETDEFY